MCNTNGESTTLQATSSLSLDRVFDLLSDRRRRYTLYYLSDQDDRSATFDELVTGILSYEPEHDDYDEFKNKVRTSLQHVHLPYLEDTGVIEYDQRSDTVRYWNQPTLEEWLEHAYHKEQLE